MSKRLLLYVLLFSLVPFTVYGQEVITGLQSNAVISKNARFRNHRALNALDTVNLPFFDDFSGASVFPDSRFWLDNFAFVNNTYSDQQVTSGVATLDALDNIGNLYTSAITYQFKADELTSQPVNLNFLPSDNIFLSFFYQAGGLSDPPEPNDSLVLQFFAPSEQKWYNVWHAAGSTDQKLKPAIIRISDDRYLKKGFQFRFQNYASLSASQNDPAMTGNCDIWNLDYVLLNRNRNAGDTVFADVAYTLPLRSLLKSHEAMPWKQFRQVYLQEMGSVLRVHYRNNDTITRNVTRDFVIHDVYNNSVVHEFSAGATNIGPLTSVEYNAGLVYTFNSTGIDSALFKVTASLKTDNFDPKQNDTLVYFQVFNNYFAFDDGTAEGGYGVNGLGSRNAMVAYRFTSFMPDTLRAVRICFNDSYLDANKRAFDLIVWDNDNGIPGNIIYSVDEVMVEQGSNINGFHNYILPEGVVVNGTFFVGWRQRSETFLNAGYDVNTLNAGKQFYWINGEWSQSQVPGSVMIRPVVGTLPLVTAVNKVPVEKKLLRFWPNPAKEYVNIDQGDYQFTGIAEIRISDLNGRMIRNVPFTDRLDISDLSDGIYILVISINGRPLAYNRLIKIR